MKEAPADLKRQVVGTWENTLPCADCDGIRYQLVLNPDGAYHEQQAYPGKSDEKFSTSGKWLLSNDSIVHLDKKEEGHQLFVFENDRLEVLDIAGKPVESGLHDAYSLKKSALQTDIWTQKAQRGIDFAALGNEPSWSLEIDFEKSMIFTSLSEPDTVVTPVPAGLQSDQITATSYTAETENGTLSITISEEVCADGMSGESFDYKVSVSAKSTDMENAVEYTGCGRYLSDNPLHGAWELESMDGQSTGTIFGKNKPYLAFLVNEGKLVGNGGCNHLSGTVQVTGKTIAFSPIISTKMACPGMEGEQQFLKSITDQEVDFSIDGEKLTLETETGPLSFRRMAAVPEK